MRVSMARSLTRVGLIIYLGLLTAGCGAGFSSPVSGVPTAPPAEASAAASAEIEPLSAAAFWAAMVPGDPEAISYPTLDAIVSGSDAVVTGTVSSIAPGPTVEDQYRNIIYWATVTLQIDDALAGSVRTAEPGTIAVSLLLGVGDAEHDFDWRYEQFASSLPSDRVVMFLSNNQEWAKQYDFPLDSPEADPMHYRVVSGQGYFRELDGRVVLPAQPIGEWPKAFDGLSFDQFVAAVRAAEAANS
jgi:hypothetical protein